MIKTILSIDVPCVSEADWGGAFSKLPGSAPVYVSSIAPFVKRKLDAFFLNKFLIY